MMLARQLLQVIPSVMCSPLLGHPLQDWWGLQENPCKPKPSRKLEEHLKVPSKGKLVFLFLRKEVHF